MKRFSEAIYEDPERTRRRAIQKYGNFARMVYGEPPAKDCYCESCLLRKARNK